MTALSDLAAALSVSLGIAPTANLIPERKFPSMFEPIHGSALDIVGQGIANPIGTFWTVVMMFQHLGEFNAAARLMGDLEPPTSSRVFTPDLGGRAPNGNSDRSVVSGHRCVAVPRLTASVSVARAISASPSEWLPAVRVSLRIYLA